MTIVAFPLNIHNKMTSMEQALKTFWNSRLTNSWVLERFKQGDQAVFLILQALCAQL